MDLPPERDTPRRDRWVEQPHVTRWDPDGDHAAEILERHGAAVDANLPTYADPISGFSVFTAAFLAKRGYCCDSGCRHCPFVV